MDAARTTVVSELTDPAAAENEVELWPEATCTLAGTVTAALFEEIATIAPVPGAGALSVTVQFVAPGALIVEGVQTNPLI